MGNGGSLPTRTIVMAFAVAYVAYLALADGVAALLPVSVVVALALAVVGWRLAPVRATEPTDEPAPAAAPPEPDASVAPAPAPPEPAVAPAANAASARPLVRLEWAALAGIVVLGAVLRLHALGRVPDGFFCDEASVGYNAYSILRTGRDEHGELMPLFFRAFGEYKNPVYIYAAVASIAALGLDEVATRVPAALFGLGTVPIAFLLGRRLFGNGVGLIAGALLAISPWHLHFSRMAFELIALPFFFGLGLWLCLEALASGRRVHYVLGGLCFAISLYTYAVARVFVPAFLIGFFVLYRRCWLGNRRGLQAAVLALVAGASPLVLYTLTNPDQAAARWRDISGVGGDRSLTENLAVVSGNYVSHFSRDFLFEHGDPLKRHSVRGFGVLYRAYLPWLVLGVVLLVASRRREGGLLLWWVALFPLAASLTRETPSATRAIDAIPVFELIVAYGVYRTVLFARSRVAGRWRPLFASAAALLFLAPLGPQFLRYLDAYFREYPIESARGLDGFQHGYRDAIRYMEARRQEYELLMLTATDTNQSEMLALFYSRRDPAEYQRTRQTGYLVSVPEEYGRYPDARILYALRPEDLRYFIDYEVRHRVLAPDGEVSFLVTEIRSRRPVLLDWLVLGPLDREEVQAGPDPVDPRHPERPARNAAGARWQAYRPEFANLDLNRHFSAPPPRENPEDSCAYLWTLVHPSRTVRGRIEIFGSPDPVTVYWNGARQAHVDALRADQALTVLVDLAAGPNQLLLRSCETVGDWNLQVSVLGEDGRPIPGLRFEAPPVPVVPGSP